MAIGAPAGIRPRRAADQNVADAFKQPDRGLGFISVDFRARRRPPAEDLLRRQMTTKQVDQLSPDLGNVAGLDGFCGIGAWVLVRRVDQVIVTMKKSTHPTQGIRRRRRIAQGVSLVCVPALPGMLAHSALMLEMIAQLAQERRHVS